MLKSAGLLILCCLALIWTASSGFGGNRRPALEGAKATVSTSHKSEGRSEFWPLEATRRYMRGRLPAVKENFSAFGKVTSGVAKIVYRRLPDMPHLLYGRWARSAGGHLAKFGSKIVGFAGHFYRRLYSTTPSLSGLKRQVGLPLGWWSQLSLKGYLAVSQRELWTLPVLKRATQLVKGASLDLSKAIKAGWVLVPKDRSWWMEFGVVSAGVGTMVGWATFGCAVVATPAGPVLVALASGACAAVAAQAGPELVKVSYERVTGLPLQLSALRAGSIVGTAVGATMGMVGADQFSKWLNFRQYKNFGGYASFARELTRKTLRPLRPQVQALRGEGYDIDHVIPVKCGWVMSIPPAVIASSSNLQGLPATINRSIGSKGCY